MIYYNRFVPIFALFTIAAGCNPKAAVPSDSEVADNAIPFDATITDSPPSIDAEAVDSSVPFDTTMADHTHIRDVSMADTVTVEDAMAVHDNDTARCVAFDALTYTIPDDGLRGPHLPGNYPCLTVGVNDACNGDPISGATIELRTMDGNSTVTTLFGQTNFAMGCRGEYTVRVSKQGFLTATVVTRPLMDRDPGAGNRFSDYVGARLVRDPDAGR